MGVKRVLFVCTGNSCRSVMAKYLMQATLQRLRIKEIQVESAGVFAMEGLPATRETKQVLLQEGIDASGHFARTLTPDTAKAADLILVMELFHLEEVLRRVPSVKGRVHLLTRYGRSPEDLPVQDAIPDPIGKPLEVYEVCCATIREQIERIAKLVAARRAAG